MSESGGTLVHATQGQPGLAGAMAQAKRYRVARISEADAQDEWIARPYGRCAHRRQHLSDLLICRSSQARDRARPCRPAGRHARRRRCHLGGRRVVDRLRRVRLGCLHLGGAQTGSRDRREQTSCSKYERHRRECRHPPNLGCRSTHHPLLPMHTSTSTRYSQVAESSNVRGGRGDPRIIHEGYRSPPSRSSAAISLVTRGSAA